MPRRPANLPSTASAEDADLALRQRWVAMRGLLDERQRRAFAAAEATALGHGGIARVMAVTGLARGTIAAGMRTMREETQGSRVRRVGGGRKAAAVSDPTLMDALQAVLSLDGDAPRSLRELAEEMSRRGHRVSHTTVARSLARAGWTRPSRAPVPLAGRMRPRGVGSPTATIPVPRPSPATMNVVRGDRRTTTSNDDRRDTIAGLANGLRVIGAFDDHRPRLTIAEVAACCELTRAAARRHLKTLQRLGYADLHNGMYALTPKVVRLAQSFMSSSRLPQIIQPELLALANTLQEASSAGVLDGDDVISVAATTIGRPVSMTVQVGTRVPAYCTSNGRVLLSCLDVATIEAWVARQRLVARTRYTLTSPQRVVDAILATRAQGYALVDQEFELGLRTLAVPLIDHRGTVVASLNVGVHASRTTMTALVERCLPALREAQARLRNVL